MMPDRLSDEERKMLLRAAREALVQGVTDGALQPVDHQALPPRLMEQGAVFVTLTRRGGDLRGCVGAIEAYQPLIDDVREHAVAAALSDYRFPPVTPEELPEIEIEISRLTPPQPLEYRDPQELLGRLRPRVDGVILRDGFRRATFLPQVWEKVPEPEIFLGMLCQKMGAPPDSWRRKKLDVATYQVEEFHE